MRLSRNRLTVVHDVEDRDWSPGFFDKLRELEPSTVDVFRETMDVARARRRSKPALKL